jgi:NodT family efflux transporter outer membrane factor (OMF) lipoprotein
MKLTLLCVSFATLSWSATLPARFHSEAPGINMDPAVERWWSTFKDPQLDSLIQRAVGANLDVKIAASRLMEARAARGVARAGLLPSVESSDSLQRVRGGLTAGIFRPSAGSQSSLLAPYQTNIFQDGFDASWEIDFFGGKRHALEAATADAASAEEARRDTLVSLLAEVARNYVELRGTQQRLEIAQRNIKLQTDSLHLTRVRSEAGLGNELDVERQLSQLAATQAMVPALESAKQTGIHRLSVLLGAEPGALSDELTQSKPLPATPPAVPVGLSGDLLKRRPDVRRADADVAAANARIGVARSDFFPKITLTGRQQERRERLMASAEASRQATQLASELYLRGLSDFLAVLDAERQQLAVEDDLAQSETAVVTNLVALYKALGGGWSGL